MRCLHSPQKKCKIQFRGEKNKLRGTYKLPFSLLVILSYSVTISKQYIKTATCLPPRNKQLKSALHILLQIGVRDEPLGCCKWKELHRL